MDILGVTVSDRGKPLLAMFVKLNQRAARRIKADKDLAGLWVNVRIPENDLLDDAWLGGIGGLWAMQQYNHKTLKREFFDEYKRRAKVCALVFEAILLLED